MVKQRPLSGPSCSATLNGDHASLDHTTPRRSTTRVDGPHERLSAPANSDRSRLPRSRTLPSFSQHMPAGEIHQIRHRYQSALRPCSEIPRRRSRDLRRGAASRATPGAAVSSTVSGRLQPGRCRVSLPTHRRSLVFGADLDITQSGGNFGRCPGAIWHAARPE